MPAALGFLFAQMIGGGVPALPTSELVVAATSGPRPAECALGSRRGAEPRSHFWRRATSAELGRHCDALARGWGRLARAPSEALALAEKAEQALPGRVGPLVLGARAALAGGDAADAWKRFEALEKAFPASLDSASTLHDYAKAALSTGHAAEAVSAYRALVPRAGLLESAPRRQAAYVEAALSVLGEGPGAVDEAVGYLAEARRRGGAPGLNPFIAGALALALERQDRHEQAAGVSAEAGGPWALERLMGAPLPKGLPVLPAGELDALVAVLAERDDRELAQRRWKSFLEGAGGKGPWAEHAKKRLAELGVKRGRR